MFSLLPNEPYKKFAVITMYVAVGIAAAWLVFTYLQSAIIPFAIAYVLAECFRPIVRYSESHLSFPRRFFVLFVVSLALISLGMLAFAICRQVVFELTELAMSAKSEITQIRTDDRYAAEVIEKISSLVPFVDLRERLWEMRANLDAELWNILVSLGEKSSGSLLSAVGSVAAFLPKMLLTSAVIVIATYYFAVDRVKINCALLSLFPKRLRPILKKSKDTVFDTVGRYLRAYGLLFLITFAELLFAFLILRVEYALLLSIIIALVDFLPILGTGTVLIPWGIASILLGDIGFGLGLLVVYAIIMVVRQILEPKIVGRFIGLSPLAALASLYFGLEVMGLIGIFVFPITAIVIKRILAMSEREPSQ